MSYTASDLSTAVLRHLAVIDATETPASADATYVQDVWRAKWEELSAHGMEMTYFAFDDIPNPTFLTVRDLVANEVSGAFGQPKTAADKEAEEIVILRRLRRHLHAPATGLPGKATYF